MTFTSVEEFEGFLLGRIPRGPRYATADARGVERARALLARLDNPQRAVRVIHIAGTSGKGSTAYLASTLLQAAGQSVGLHVSPHLTDLRERFQIDNELVPWHYVLEGMNEILPAIQEMDAGALGPPTYFEILLALAFQLFRQRQVAYAVVETGLGGRHDGTNLPYRQDTVVILTRIGLDHTDILGKRIADIAGHKAAIIQPGNVVFSSRQVRAARAVIEQATSEAGATVEYVRAGATIRRIRADWDDTTFDFSRAGVTLSDVRLGIIGAYQAENASLALAAVQSIAARDGFSLPEGAIRDALGSVRIPGRAERFDLPGKGGTQLVLLDGAHNPQKMRALIGTLRLIDDKRRYDFLIAFQQGKDYRKMLHTLLPMARSITVTSFRDDRQDAPHISEDPERVVAAVRTMGFAARDWHADPREALLRALDSAEGVSPAPLIVTGSLYLCGLLRPILNEYMAL